MTDPTDTPESVAAAIRPHDLTPDDGAVMVRSGLLRRAADLLTSQAAEIARLSEERDRARGEHRTLADLYEVTLPEAREERDGWKARATQAEAALAAARAEFGRAGLAWQRERMRLEVANDEMRAALAAERAQAQVMREALEREAAWNEAEAAMCDRQAEGFKGRNGDRMMRHRCEAAADAHRKAVRRLRAALSTGESS